MHKQLGENNSQAKLTTVQVKEIKALLAQGVRQRPLAKQFGVSVTTIARIARKENWVHT